LVTRARFFKLSLWLPILVPLPLLGLGWLLPELFLVPAVFFGGSLLYAAPTYPVFAFLTYRYLRNRPLRSWEQTSLWLPMLYAPICGIGTSVAFTLLAGRKPLMETLTSAADVSLVALAFGYGYVMLVWIIAARMSADSSTDATASVDSAAVVPPGT
jgi:hypothetical protein